VVDKDKVHTIDYGTGDEPYKADWMDNRQQLYTLSLYNPKKLSGFFGAAKSGLSNILKRK
jgi:CelD/BcsL family acetyltransferase involved in cellulose biosynthesis